MLAAMVQESAAHASFDDLLTLGVEVHHDHRRLVIRGEIDMSTAPLIERQLLRFAADGQRPVVVDLRGVTFMDVTGLRVFLDANARSLAGSNRLTLIPGPEAVQRIFELTGTLDHLSFVAE